MNLSRSIRCPLAPLTLLLAATLAAVSCGHRADRVPTMGPRPPADLFVSVLVLAPDGSEPAPALFTIEPGGQLRAAEGAGAARDVLPPRTRRLTDAQVGQIYGDIVREGLALPATDRRVARSPRIEVTVIAHSVRQRGVHPIDNPQARALVERFRRLARIDPAEDAPDRTGG